MISVPALRRKLDYQILRWQARLDGEWADRVLPVAAAAGLFVVFAALALARARSLDTGVELARWAQGAWLLTHGHTPTVTVTGEHLLEPHGAFGFVLVAQGVRLLAAVPYLLVLQAAALAAAAFPIWRICRVVCSLRAGAAAAAVTAYALYPPLHQLNLADFHPETLAVPFLLGGAYAGMRERWWWATALLVVAMSMRSDLGLVVAAIGVVLFGRARTKQAPRLVVGGVAWALLSLIVLQPAVGDGGFVHAAAFAEYGTSVPSVLWGMAGDPVGVLGDLVARENFVAVVGLLAPLAFLPVLSPRILLPVVPVLALIFVADVPVTASAGAPNLVPAIVFAFLALPFTLAKIGRRNIERITVDRRLLGALTLAALVFFVQDAPSSPYHRPWEWGGRTLSEQALVAAIDRIEPAARVRAPEAALAELGGRRLLVIAEPARRVGPRAYTAGVDAVLLDDSVLGSLSADAYDEFVDTIRDEGFRLVYDRSGVLLFTRDR